MEAAFLLAQGVAWNRWLGKREWELGSDPGRFLQCSLRRECSQELAVVQAPAALSRRPGKRGPEPLTVSLDDQEVPKETGNGGRADLRHVPRAQSHQESLNAYVFMQSGLRLWNEQAAAQEKLRGIWKLPFLWTEGGTMVNTVCFFTPSTSCS